ncbi:MAG: hypothetical protein U0794_08295 [Isosphaeraceae bacterium]
MSSSANVKSVEAIRDFRIAMTTFAEDARNALSAVEMEIRRIRDWLQRDQLSYWQTQVKRCNEQLSMARTELHRRRISQSNSDAISDTEQKEAVRMAQRRLEHAEDKVQTVKRWVPILEHAISEYHAASQPLGDNLTGSFQNSIHVLDRMIASLEAYLATAPPPAPSMPAPTSVREPTAAVTSSTLDRPQPAPEAASPEPAAPEPAPTEEHSVPEGQSS